MKPAMWEDLIFDWTDLVLVLIGGGACTVLLYVAIGILREARASRRWPQTTGTVLTSCVESRKKTPGDNDSDTAVINSPNVVYEYQVNDQSFRGSRIDLGQRTSEYELESILDRYPVGAEVVVYYNPADPQDAVLERDAPAGTFWIGGGCVLFSIAVPIIAILIYYKAIDWLDGGAIVVGGMGLATLGLAIAYTATSAQARRWPTTRGRIVFAGVDEFRSRRRTHFRHSVRYTYEVNGRQFLGDRVHLAAVISSTIPWLAGYRRRSIRSAWKWTFITIRRNPRNRCCIPGRGGSPCFG